MRAALLKKIGSPLVVEDVPVPTIMPDEVLVETRTCGICRTDLHIQSGLAYIPHLPHIPGHEPAGVVAAVGANVKDFSVGQRVVPHLFVSGGECCYSRTGRHAQTMNLQGIIGVTMPGAFAEYFKAPARNLLHMPDSVPFDVGGLTSCAVITAVHAYRKMKLQAGDVAVVVGAGGIGQIMIQILRHAGIRVVAASRSKESLELARKNGATLCVQLDSPTAAEQVRAFAGPQTDGAHCVIDMVGLASTMKASADFVMRCGQIIVIGEETDFPPIDTIHIAQRELEIIGSRNGGFQDAADSLKMMSDGIITPPIAEHFPLERINDAMGLLRSGKAHGRIVIDIKN